MAASKKKLKPVDLNFDEPGKDLSRLFAASLSKTPDVRHAEMLSIDRLLDNPFQPRISMHEESLQEFADVIRGQGFQGVLTARHHPERRGYYQLAAGHRRREAAKRAGLLTLPIVVMELTDEEMVTLAITENIQREDLTPLEEGRIFLLMNENMGYTLEQISREVGKKIGYVYNRLRVAKAPLDVQALVEAKPDSLRAVANLIQVESAEDRAPVIAQLLLGRITTDDLPLYIKEHTRQHTGRPIPDLSYVQLQALKNINAVEAGPAPSVVGADVATSVEEGATEIATSPLAESTVIVNGQEMVVEREERDPVAERMSAYAEERRAIQRARRSKLSRILGLLQQYSNSVDETELSQEERIDLATLGLLADRLCLRFNIRKEG